MPTRLFFRSTVYDVSSDAFPGSGWEHLSLTQGGIGSTSTAGNGVLAYDLAYNPTLGRYLIVGDSGQADYQTYIAWTDKIDGPWNYYQDPTIYQLSATGGGINAAIYVPSSGLFVIANDSGVIWTSPNGEDGSWTLRYTSPVGLFVNKITIANGIVIVACPQSTIIYSTDGGLTWTTANVGFTGSNACREVIHDGTRYIAVGQSGQLAYATTLTGTWTQTTVGITNSDCWTISYSPTLGRYCVGMGNATVRTATSVLVGATWTVATGTFGGSVGMIRWANGRFVACGDGRSIGTSTNGTAFTVTQYNTSTTKADIWGVYNFTGGNTWFAVTEYYPSLMWESTNNGTSWQPTGTENSVNTISVGQPSAERKAVYASEALVLRTLSTTAGTTQRQVPITSVASTTANQTAFLDIFASPPLNGAQTVGGGTMILNTADGESNLNLNFWINAANIYVWRPSTGQVVGYLRDATNVSLGGTEPPAASTTAAYVTNITGITSTAVSAQDGDIVVAEVWARFTPGMATSYNGYFYYDGAVVNTTENALVTNHASFLELTENLVFKGPAITAARTETVTATDSQITQNNIWAPTITEPANALETQNATKAFDVDITESVSATDTVEASFSIHVDADESVTATDSQTEDITKNATQSESVTATETQASQLDAVASISESVTAQASETVVADFQVAQSETVTATDAETASFSTSADQSESVTATDSEDSILEYGVSITESVSATDSETNTLLARGVNDEGGIVVDTLLAGGSSTYSTLDNNFGINFTAPKTCTLSSVSIFCFRDGAATTNPIITLEQNGTVIATKTVSYFSISLNAGANRNNFNLDGDGFDLVEGLSYTIYITATTGTLYPMRYQATSSIYGPWNENLARSKGITPFNFSLGMPIFVLQESIATDAQTTNVNWQVAQNESALATDSENAVFAFPVDITETVTATDTEEASFSVGVNQDETVTATDSEDATYAYGVAVTETVNAADSETNVLTANAWISEGDVQQNLISGTGGGLSSTNTLSRNYGQSFIANKTGVLGYVQVGLYRTNTSASLPADDGEIQLWQLDSNTLGGIPQTLLTSVPMQFASLGTSATNIANYYFGNTVLTEGVGYAIVVVKPSTATASTQYPSITFTSSNVPFYNYFKAFNADMLRTVVGGWGFDAGRLLRVFVALEDATDTQLAGFVSSSDITEAVTATDDETATLDQAVDITETVTATVSEDSILQYGVSVSESVTATETQTNTLAANAWITNNELLAYPPVDTGGVGSTLSTVSARGTTFIARETSKITGFTAYLYRTNTANPLPTEPFTMELWELASASITAAPSILIASKAFDILSIGTSSSTFRSLYFDEAQNTTIQAGKAYALLVRRGSDWSSTTQTVSFVTQSAGLTDLQNFYNYLKPIYQNISISTGGFSSFSLASNPVLTTIHGNTFETQLPGLAYQVAQDEAALALDSEDAVFAISVDQNETVTATDTEDTTYSTTANQDESVTATDEETASIPVSAAQDEAVTATDSETNTLTTNAEQDEAVTATDSETANFATSSDITESVTATESNVVYVDFTAQITETLNLVSSETAVSVLPVSITEAVAANDEWVAETSAIFNVTGVQANTFLGTASINTDQILSVTGVQGTTQLGTAAVVGSAVVDLTGVQGTTQLGTATVTGTTNVYPTSVTALGAVGNVSLVTNNFINVTGVQGATNLGTASISIGEFVNVTGVQGTTQLGSVSVVIGQFVNVSGVQADIILNKVNVWGNIVPNPTGPWSNVNDSQSNNWVIIDKAA